MWVLGFVQIQTKKLFLNFLLSRGHKDIIPFITKWIKKGCTIRTDKLPTYNILKHLDYNLEQVNHSIGFIQDGIHTNRIEGIFGLSKKVLRSLNVRFNNIENLNNYLAEIVFRYTYNSFDRRKAFLLILYILKKNN